MWHPQHIDNVKSGHFRDRNTLSALRLIAEYAQKLQGYSTNSFFKISYALPRKEGAYAIVICIVYIFVLK